ncbi:MAG: response regulator [Bacteroidales bacterium]|nr:response regulator [Bacteroidales bacterium]
MKKIDQRLPVILVTEDDISNFHMMEVMINQYVKATIIWARNGVEAIEICTENPDIDLVLMDIKLPLLNGMDATRAIKKIRPSLPIIAITAYALIGDERKVRDAGCDDYLPKPIRLPQFLKALGKYIPIL